MPRSIALSLCSLPLLFLLAAEARAADPQSLSVDAGGTRFESDDDGITLVPMPNGAFSLSASSKGASAWPPPKTPINRLGIVCDGMQPGKPMKLDAKSFERSVCDVTYNVGEHGMGKPADAEYTLDKDATGNVFEVTLAAGKRYEGRFEFQLKHKETGAALQLKSGRFDVEDRQY